MSFATARLLEENAAKLKQLEKMMTTPSLEQRLDDLERRIAELEQRKTLSLGGKRG